MSRICYGSGAAADTAQVLASLGARRVLLVCGRRSFEASGAAAMLPGLRAGAEVRRWDDFDPNTDAADLARGLEVAEDFRPDAVLGVGGGSAMDMAKLLCAFPGSGEAERVRDAIRAGAVARKRPRLVLVPTTSGSGSEATHFAVVYIGQQKYSVAGGGLLPDAVVLDPALTLSGSRYQRATSGIDAVCQAVESLWAVGATEESRGYARRALRALLPAIEEFAHRPAAGSARAMAVGSHLAGRAINITKTTAAHALSYGITKGYGVSHGHAVALTLGAFVECHGRAPAGALQAAVDPAAHRRSMEWITAALGASDAAQARVRFTELARRIGLTMGLSAVGVGAGAPVRALAAGVNTERLGNNPVRFTSAGLAELLASAA